MVNNYIVVCKDDDDNYVLATRRVFTHEEAAEYTVSIAECREPIIVWCPRGLDFY